MMEHGGLSVKVKWMIWISMGCFAHGTKTRFTTVGNWDDFFLLDDSCLSE